MIHPGKPLEFPPLLPFTKTDGGVGGCQTAGAGSFPRTKREVFGGTKIQVSEFGVECLNFGATYLSFGSIYLSPYI